MKESNESKELKELAIRLGFKGMVANWSDYASEPLIKKLLAIEDEDKNRRSLERRLKESQIKEMKPASDFDWSWPASIDRELIEELFTLKFMEEHVNVIFLAANGLGKSMLSKNLLHAAVLAGYRTKFVSASLMLPTYPHKTEPQPGGDACSNIQVQICLRLMSSAISVTTIATQTFFTKSLTADICNHRRLSRLTKSFKNGQRYFQTPDA